MRRTALELRRKKKSMYAISRRVFAIHKNHSGVMVCITLVTAFIAFGLAPRAGVHLFNSGEIFIASRLAVSAKNALLEGQFPLQFANDFEVLLQPVFLYYTPFAYGIAGIIQIATGLDPYNSILIVIGMVVSFTAAGTYRVIRVLGGDPISSGIVAGAIPFTPYFMTDIFLRSAIPELTAWAVLPWVIFFFLKFCINPRHGNALGLILSSALLIVSHKIFFPWTLLFLSGLGFGVFGWRKMLMNSPVLALCLLSSLSLSAPYWLNAMLISPSLLIAGSLSHVAYQNLTTDFRLFWPLPYTHPSLIEQYGSYSLQLGPIIFAALVVGPLFPMQREIKTIWVLTAIAALFACSFFALPNLWNYLPIPLTAIQFPYRMIVFAATFGWILAGLVLSKASHFSRPIALTCSGLLFLLLLGFWRIAPSSGQGIAALSTINAPNQNNDYFETGNNLSDSSSAQRINREAVHTVQNTATLSFSSSDPKLLIIPVQYSRHLNVSINQKSIPFWNTKGLMAIVVPAGQSKIAIERIEPVNFPTSVTFSVMAMALLGWQLRSKRGLTAQ